MGREGSFLNALFIDDCCHGFIPVHSAGLIGDGLLLTKTIFTIARAGSPPSIYYASIANYVWPVSAWS